MVSRNKWIKMSFVAVVLFALMFVVSPKSEEFIRSDNLEIVDVEENGQVKIKTLNVRRQFNKVTKIVLTTKGYTVGSNDDHTKKILDTSIKFSEQVTLMLDDYDFLDYSYSVDGMFLVQSYIIDVKSYNDNHPYNSLRELLPPNVDYKKMKYDNYADFLQTLGYSKK